MTRFTVRSVLLATALALSAPVLAATPPAANGWGIATTDVPADPSIRLGTLPNGMKYAVMRNGTPKGGASVRLRFDLRSSLRWPSNETTGNLRLFHSMAPRYQSGAASSRVRAASANAMTSATHMRGTSNRSLCSGISKLYSSFGSALIYQISRPSRFWMAAMSWLSWYGLLK